MYASKLVRPFAIALAVAAVPVLANAQIVISANIAPPPLPVYVQPVAPGDGYYWTPGYWAYGPDGYYWVPGVWVRPPRVGYLWTPPYWGFFGGSYGFHAGYWGTSVGYYGGINYGYGYGGFGYGGGRWQGGTFAYNTAVSNVNVNVVHNTYVENVSQNVSTAHTSFNGPGGVQAQPTPEQSRAEHEQHLGPTASQQQHFQAAQQNRAQYASANGGRPQTLAMPVPGGVHANEFNNRQAHQQAHDARMAHAEQHQAQHEQRQAQHERRQQERGPGQEREQRR